MWCTSVRFLAAIKAADVLHVHNTKFHFRKTRARDKALSTRASGSLSSSPLLDLYHTLPTAHPPSLFEAHPDSRVRLQHVEGVAESRAGHKPLDARDAATILAGDGVFGWGVEVEELRRNSRDRHRLPLKLRIAHKVTDNFKN